MTKKYRHEKIKEIIRTNEVHNQDELLCMLTKAGFVLTQATLSRDIKELKIIKIPGKNGDYIYQLTDNIAHMQEKTSITSYGFVSIEFSGHLAVIKTRPGYAMGIAAEIDNKATDTILGTVAGDDTILVIPRDKKSKQEVLRSLAAFIPIK